MTINSDYNSRMIAEAYTVLAEKGSIDVYALRDKTRVRLERILIDPTDNQVVIDDATRTLMLRDVARKTEETADYYFFNKRGQCCFVSRETIKRFQQLANEQFPQNVIYGSISIIDSETEVELVSVDDYSFMKGAIQDFAGVKAASPDHHLSKRYSILTIFKEPPADI